jgi:hypothetical protein
MLARLSASDYPELAELRTRDLADGSIALLDAWATVADVLTFYQERIANEGYLRTATERRSLVELGRLINYAPRPGVAASVYLAFEMEKDPPKAVIPKGTKVNSIPGPGETMEAFETSEEITARPEWNAIKPRLVQPQSKQSIKEHGLYLKGKATKLKVGDLMLVRSSPAEELVAVRIMKLEVDHDRDRTRVDFVDRQSKGDHASPSFLQSLLRQPTVAPASAARLTRSIETSFAASADTWPRLAAAFQPALADTLYPALRNSPPKAKQEIEVYAMRIEARAFGHNAPLRLTHETLRSDFQPKVRSELVAGASAGARPTFGEWDIAGPLGNSDRTARQHRTSSILLDNDYDVAPQSFAVIEWLAPEKGGEIQKQIVIDALDSVQHISLNAYGLSGKSVEISFSGSGHSWIPNKQSGDGGTAAPAFSIVRSARVFLGSERLELADVPINEKIEGGRIELDGLYEGLDPGRWLIIEGERTDITDEQGAAIPGIRGAELVMLGGVGQAVRVVVPATAGAATSTAIGVDRPQPTVKSDFVRGDTYHTTITLAGTTAARTSGLAYTYKRDTVTIYANVAKATHGETRTETLGSGNAAEALQQFRLKLPPLTHVAAQSSSGTTSTLEIRVNDILWKEAATLAETGPNDRKFTTRTGDDDKVDVIFGDGRHGLRLPTGCENVKAQYRSGIGKPGNVKARQISLLGSRPLGAKGVINPMRASGGANRDEAEAIRRNAPLAILALDRLISTSDYADFARSFGGIGKASAVRKMGVVEVVIAGVDDIAIDESSDLFRTLKDALHRYGDPLVQVKLMVRKRASLIIKAGVRIESDYLWEAVEPKIRAGLLDTFSFDNQALGAPVFLSHAMRTLHKVKGVAAADIDVFSILTERQFFDQGARIPAAALTKAWSRISLEPEQIAYLLPNVPETLILQEVTA